MLISVLDPLRELTAVSVLLRLALAMLFGGTIGLERGRKHRAAGFRTYMLVCMGSALTGILSQYLFIMCKTAWAAEAALVGRSVDVSRIGAKVYSGIGFLSAGTILVTGKKEVKGLTTAAGLWVSACMGIAIGAGFYECVLISFALILLCMQVLPTVENRIVENGRNMTLYVELVSLEHVGELIGSIKALDAQILEIDLDRGGQERRPSAALSIRLAHKLPHTQVMTALFALESVTVIHET